MSAVFALQPGIFQEDLYPKTAGNQAAMTAQEWLSGTNRGQYHVCVTADRLGK